MPEHLYFTGADNRSGFGEADFDRFGMPRPYNPALANEAVELEQTSLPSATDGPGFGLSSFHGNAGLRPTSGGASGVVSGPTLGGESNSSGSAAAPPQINVNIQAMDSQSFLDHSDEIAQAVRQAMLSLNSINDVMNEL
jgi:hypothetical protein